MHYISSGAPVMRMTPQSHSAPVAIGPVAAFARATPAVAAAADFVAYPLSPLPKAVAGTKHQDPAAVEELRRECTRSIEEELEEAQQRIALRTQQQRERLHEAALEQKRQYNSQVDQAVQQAEAALDEVGRQQQRAQAAHEAMGLRWRPGPVVYVAPTGEWGGGCLLSTSASASTHPSKG
mmetsp:Transcript_48317/g.103609  ORF Transcript_48317/g.103609 Transcript_48317/m.103609 type:complete len:180 (+) Transcript_48317:74-613(+)